MRGNYFYFIVFVYVVVTTAHPGVLPAATGTSVPRLPAVPPAAPLSCGCQAPCPQPLAPPSCPRPLPSPSRPRPPAPPYHGHCPRRPPAGASVPPVTAGVSIPRLFFALRAGTRRRHVGACESMVLAVPAASVALAVPSAAASAYVPHGRGRNSGSACVRFEPRRIATTSSITIPRAMTEN